MSRFASDYDQWLHALRERRTAPVPILEKNARLSAQGRVENEYKASPHFEIYESLGDHGSAVQYTVGAMARVDPRYTEITIEQGERVKGQLQRAFERAGFVCDFEYQGSVTNNTHIKSYSDIDLLAITQRFTTLESPQVPSRPYEGNPVEDLREIRAVGTSGIRGAFPKADVDDSGAKSVTVSGGSLSRKIDVVPANWFDTNAYARHQAKRYRAIQILDMRTGDRVKNSPFMHNYLIEERNTNTQGGLRKVIRLMKSLKYDSGTISLSSYDLTAISYNMPEHQLLTSPGSELALLVRLKWYLDLIGEDPDLREDMLVPDKSRHVFTDGHATTTGLSELQDEVDDLVEAVSHNRKKSFEKLAEARLAY